jgi:hypothetical protein
MRTYRSRYCRFSCSATSYGLDDLCVLEVPHKAGGLVCLTDSFITYGMGALLPTSAQWPQVLAETRNSNRPRALAKRVCVLAWIDDVKRVQV